MPGPWRRDEAHSSQLACGQGRDLRRKQCQTGSSLCRSRGIQHECARLYERQADRAPGPLEHFRGSVGTSMAAECRSQAGQDQLLSYGRLSPRSRAFGNDLDLNRSVHQCRSTTMCWWRSGSSSYLTHRCFDTLTGERASQPTYSAHDFVALRNLCGGCPGSRRT